MRYTDVEDYIAQQKYKYHSKSIANGLITVAVGLRLPTFVGIIGTVTNKGKR
jgi:hypothetical protein